MSQIGCFSRLIGSLFLIGLIALGGFMVYQAGLAQGIAQAPALAEPIQTSPPVTLAFPSFFSVFGAVCLSILGLFLFFGLVKSIFCFTRFGKEMGQTPDGTSNQTM